MNYLLLKHLCPIAVQREHDKAISEAVERSIWAEVFTQGAK